ncbi:FtsK/SpoIIIE domain-containing protein [Paeniglutamicibacter sp.]|uniref:FtsK/SpoIIIE domain-containing protein n=1 Tax=Paeniglutamicibacter sp. TaxID=1934391 RepID=UPI00398A36E5
MAYIVEIPSTYNDTLLGRHDLVKRLRKHLSKRPEADGAVRLWNIEQISTVDGRTSAILVEGIPHTRPNQRLLTIQEGARITASQLLDVEALQRKEGRTLVEVNLASQKFVTAEIAPAVFDVRNRIARALNVKPFDIDVTATWHPEFGIDGIYIQRLPYYPEEKLQGLLTEALIQVGGTRHWDMAVSQARGAAKMLHRLPDSLAKTLSLAETFPDGVIPLDWKRLPLGVGPQGTPICQDLTATPHGLVAGPTGSGKTIALIALCSSALLRGHSLVMLDPTKGGLDFLPLKPFCLGWATTLEGAADAIQQMYVEVSRRKKVLSHLRAPNWQSASPEDQKKYNLVPITILIDEFGSLALEIPIPKSLPKDDPIVEELQAQNAAKAMIKTYAGKIAREARFAGVFLQVALQRPDAAIMGSGEFRSNLGMRTQLVSPVGFPDNTTLGMLFDSEMIESARERMSTLADGSHGLAIVAGEGGRAQGVKVPYSDPAEVEAMLRSRGVPFVTSPLKLKEGTETVTVEELPQWWQEIAKDTPRKPVPDTAPEPTGVAPEPAAPEPAWAAAPEPAWGKQPAKDLIW